MNNLETNNISIKNKMPRFPRKLNINKLNKYSLKIVEKISHAQVQIHHLNLLKIRLTMMIEYQKMKN